MNECKVPILYKSKSECCGCTACYAICPVGAINMKPDKEGFLYPQINAQVCIRCYQCVQICEFKKNQHEKVN